MINHIYRKRVLVNIILSFFFLFPFQKLKAQSEYDFEVIQYTVKCYANKEKSTTTVTVILQINNQNGLHATKISIPYNKQRRIRSLKGSILNMKGDVIRKLKNNEIDDVSALSEYAFYNDINRKKFELVHNQYPYRVFYEYTLEEKEFFSIIDWTPVEYYNVPTWKAELFLTIPTEYKVNIFQKDIEPYKVETTDNITNYQWKCTYDEIIDNEVYSPPRRSLLPNVKIVPLNFTYDVDGSLNNWIEYGNWEYELISELSDLPEAEKEKVFRIIDAKATKKEQIKALYYYLQDNTRYIYVQIEQGGMKPYPASYVALNKYGDCKALTNYMMALLKLIEVESYYTNIILDNNPPDIITHFPSMQFNHVLLVVPFEEDTIFLECTSKNDPFGYVGTSIQNRHAFIIMQDNSHMIKTPKSSINDQKIVRNIIINCSPGHCTTELDFRYKGFYYEWLNDLNSYSNINELSKKIHRFIPFKNYNLDDWNIYKQHRDTAKINLNANITLSHYIKTYDDKWIMELLPIISLKLESPDERQTPLKINYPLFIVDSIQYKYSNNLDFIDTKEKLITSEFGKYEIEFKETDEGLLVTRYLILYIVYCPVKKYEDFYNFIQEIKQFENNINIILKKNE